MRGLFLVFLTIGLSGCGEFPVITSRCIGTEEGTAAKPYFIRTAADFSRMEGSSASFQLCNDIDLTGATSVPVQMFKGALDGKGYTLSHFTISESANQYLGLFRQTTGATFSNLQLSHFNISSTPGNQGTGALVGNATGTHFESISADSIQVAAVSRLGGIVGFATDSFLTDVTLTGSTVTASSGDMGGLVGVLVMTTEPSIDNVLRVRVKSTTITAKGYHSGGVAGFCSNCHIRFADISATIKDRGFSGGIIGGYAYYGKTGQHTVIRNARFEGDLPVIPPESYTGCIGGLVGGDDQSGGTIDIQYSLSLADITNSDPALGTIIGCPTTPGSTANSVFTNTDQLKVTYSGFTANLTVTGPTSGFTTSQLSDSSNYPAASDWFDSTIWTFDGISPPKLAF